MSCRENIGLNRLVFNIAHCTSHKRSVAGRFVLVLTTAEDYGSRVGVRQLSCSNSVGKCVDELYQKKGNKSNFFLNIKIKVTAMG